ncbi:hypothetical protein EON63_24895, partial [archaeon]
MSVNKYPPLQYTQSMRSHTYTLHHTPVYNTPYTIHHIPYLLVGVSRRRSQKLTIFSRTPSTPPN